MPKGVKVQKVYEDEIEEPVRQKKVRIMDGQLHQQRIKQKGQRFDDFDQKSNHQKTKQEKNKENQKKGEMLFQQRQKQKAISECEFCLSNEKLSQYYIRNQSTNVMLVLPKILQCLYYQQCQLSIYNELEMQKMRLYEVVVFDKANLELHLLLKYFKFKYVPHAIIECVAIPYKISKKVNLNLYFKQGMDGFWPTYKRLLKFKRIPKGFGYFYVDFSLKMGYAHVIENENNFSSNFAREILASILSVDKSNVLSPKLRTEQEVKQENDAFQLILNSYDWTVLLRQ